MRNILLAFACLSSLFAFGQTYSIYPEPFFSYLLHSPEKSFLQNTNDFQAFILHKQQVGLFENIYQTKACINYNQKRSSYTFQVHSEKEGDFISQNRLNFRYSVKTKLSKNTSLGVFFQPGFVNYKIGDDKVLAGSDFAPDLTAGVLFGLPKTFVTVNSSHIGSFSVTPIGTELVLKNYYTLSIHHNLYDIKNYGIDIHTQGLFFPQGKDMHQIGFSFYRKDLLKFIVAATSYGDMIYAAELNIINKNKYNCLLNVSFENQNQLKSTGMRIPYFNIGIIIHKAADDDT